MDFMIVLYIVLYIVVYLIICTAFFKLAQKAGLDGIAWFAYVPILNSILQLRLIQRSGWWVLMLLVPIANVIFAIIWQVKLLNAFGKNGAHVLFMIFLPPVYLIQWIVWGFSSTTTYQLGSGSVPPGTAGIPV
jgi:hypothetical protein